MFEGYNGLYMEYFFLSTKNLFEWVKLILQGFSIFLNFEYNFIWRIYILQ